VLSVSPGVGPDLVLGSMEFTFFLAPLRVGFRLIGYKRWLIWSKSSRASPAEQF
jgi:hypothetical protein